MPSGKAHLRIEAVVLGVSIGIGIGLACNGVIGQHEIIAFAGSYILSMFLLSPDLDLTRSRAYRRWGPLRWLWLPYAALFKHRQLSHHPLLGPLTRILYLTVWILACSFVYTAVTRRAVALPALRGSLLWILLLGLYLPNLTHILSDRIHTAWRRRRAVSRL